jgi:hypothetical protein
MSEITTIPRGVLSTLSFMSEILGVYDTFSEGMITWAGKDPGDGWFASLCWDDEARYVEIMDDAEPKVEAKTGHNAVYTILGYCRCQGIYCGLLGADLPSLRNGPRPPFDEVRKETA